MSNTVILIKYCIGLLFWVILSSIPLMGIVFVCLLPFYSFRIVNLLSIQVELNLWICFIVFFLLAICAFLFNSLSQIYLIREDYSDITFKEKNLRYTIIIYMFSILLGTIFIFTSDILFSIFFTLIICF